MIERQREGKDSEGRENVKKWLRPNFHPLEVMNRQEDAKYITMEE